MNLGAGRKHTKVHLQRDINLLFWVSQIDEIRFESGQELVDSFGLLVNLHTPVK